MNVSRSKLEALIKRTIQDMPWLVLLGSAVMIISVKQLSDVLLSISTVVIAYFAYCQHRLGTIQLKLEAYDRRVEIYGAIKRFISRILESPSDEEQLDIFLRQPPHARFLFEDDDIPSFIEVLYRKGTELVYKERELNRETLPQKQQEKLEQETSTLKKWFEDQHDVVDTKFNKYLHLKK